MGDAPGLQCAARDVQHRGCLTLGDTLGVQRSLLRTHFSAFEARPALVPILMVTLLVMDDRCYSSLLSTPFAWLS